MLAMLLDKTMLTSDPSLLQHTGYFVSSMSGQQHDLDSVMWGSRHPRVKDVGIKQTARRRRGKGGMPMGERELTDSVGMTRPASVASWEGYGGPAA